MAARLVAWAEPGRSVLQRAAAWHHWAPRWLPSRVAIGIRRSVLRRYRQPVLCRIDGGLQFVAHPSDLLQCLVGTTGGWEEGLLNAVRPLVGAGEAVLDIGAHVGYTAVLFADWVGPNGRIYAFEPVPQHRDQLSRNVGLNGFQHRVTMVACAVSDRTGVQPFYDSHRSNTGMGSLSARRGAAATRQVETVVIDEWVSAARSSDPASASTPNAFALAKIDVEGAELAVVRGMQQTLAHGRVRAVLIELHPDVAPAARAEIRELFDRLPVRYTLFDWHSDGGFRTEPLDGTVFYILAVRADASGRMGA